MLTDLVVPGLGRLVDVVFKVRDVLTSVASLTSDHPVLVAPLPSPFPGLRLELDIPLGKREDGEPGPGLAVCVAPVVPSFTGGWALEPDQHEHSPAAVRNATDIDGTELSRIELYEAFAVSPDLSPAAVSLKRRPTGCIVEMDLSNIALDERDARQRARQLHALASEYAPRLREEADLQDLDVLIITNLTRHSGLWIWLREPADDYDGKAELGQSTS